MCLWPGAGDLREKKMTWSKDLEAVETCLSLLQNKEVLENQARGDSSRHAGLSISSSSL